MIENLQYRCCFCNAVIQSDIVNPCDINILINVDKPKDKQDNQTFYCHINCFKLKLHEEMKKYLVVDVIDEGL